MPFDLTHVPFSRAGSRFSLRQVPVEGQTAPQLVLGFIPRGTIFRLDVLQDGQPVAYAVDATAQRVILTAAGGRITFAFETGDRLRMLAEGLTLRFSADGGAFNYVLPRGDRRWQLNMFNANRNFLLTALSGKIAVDAPWQVTKAAYIDVRISSEAALEVFTTTAPEEQISAPFAEVAAREPEGLTAFLAGLPAAPEEFAAARELAGYILWSALVKAEGHFTRNAMLMSKNHMTQVWSWDHCFNAMALAAGHPELAWDQLMIMFDQQDADGCLPDSMSQENIVWNFVKPPVHGWALSVMLDRNPALIARVPEIADKLARWTAWWLRARDDDGDGMPQYNHGNDSGWDNATCFDVPPPVEGPDLAAFLITQMETLAGACGQPQWRERADALLRTLLTHAWDGERFRATQSGAHAVAPGGDSLIPFMPLLLGERLPAEIRAKLIAGVSEPGRFFTEWGPATESPCSPRYEPDGYWRGPIWAPSTYILYAGLRRCGEDALAREVALRFCRLCAKSGLAENYDALTGAPLRDKAYTWTASVFLLLANDLGDYR